MAPPSLPQPSPPPLLPPLSYRGFPNAFTYNEAREHCALDGGIIAVPHSEEERLAIMAARTADNYTWVGYTLPKNKDIRTKYDKYVGEDGAASVAAFNYWHHNEPSGDKRSWARGVWMEPGTGRWWMGCSSASRCAKMDVTEWWGLQKEDVSKIIGGSCRSSASTAAARPGRSPHRRHSLHGLLSHLCRHSRRHSSLHRLLIYLRRRPRRCGCGGGGRRHSR